jgi:RHS repeat-associated protein
VPPILAGHQITEVSSSGSWNRGEIYADSRHLATYNNGTTFFNHEDWLGTERARSNVSATVCETISSGVWGDMENTSGSCSDSSPMHFTGKMRDTESNLDDFDARYNSSQWGRFMSPDPIGATPLHLVNPQRWNMYSYGLDSPVFYVDPDGRDAVAVNFSRQDPVVGHEGIISVHADGTATYARFGPAEPGSLFGKGEVESTLLPVKVDFGPDGLPTEASSESLLNAAASFEQQDPNSIQMSYFKTSEADTKALDNWIKSAQEASDKGSAPPYSFCGPHNCATFAIAGLFAGGAIKSRSVASLVGTPNLLAFQLSLLADKNYDKTYKRQGTRTKVSAKACHTDGTGCVSVQ